MDFFKEFSKFFPPVFLQFSTSFPPVFGFDRNKNFSSSTFCRNWAGKILNVHPSLLPKYAGGMDTNVHSEVLRNNDHETGCTIHFVTEEVDSGPILVQKKCSVNKKDTISSLKEKVQKLEGEAFIEAIKTLSNKGVS